MLQLHLCCNLCYSETGYRMRSYPDVLQYLKSVDKSSLLEDISYNFKFGRLKLSHNQHLPNLVNNENVRSSHFQSSQNVRSSHFQSSQNVRSSHFQSSQNVRSSNFQSSQNVRSSNFQSSQNVRSSHFQSSQNVRSSHFQSSQNGVSHESLVKTVNSPKVKESFNNEFTILRYAPMSHIGKREPTQMTSLDSTRGSCLRSGNTLSCSGAKALHQQEKFSLQQPELSYLLSQLHKTQASKTTKCAMPPDTSCVRKKNPPMTCISWCFEKSISPLFDVFPCAKQVPNICTAFYLPVVDTGLASLSMPSGVNDCDNVPPIKEPLRKKSSNVPNIADIF